MYIVRKIVAKVRNKQRNWPWNNLPCPQCSSQPRTYECYYLMCEINSQGLKQYEIDSDEIDRIVEVRIARRESNKAFQLTVKKDQCLCGADPMTEECRSERCSFEHILACWADKSPEFLSMIERNLVQFEEKQFDEKTINAYYRSLTREELRVLFEQRLVFGCRGCGTAVPTEECERSNKSRNWAVFCNAPKSLVMRNWMAIMRVIFRELNKSKARATRCKLCLTKPKTDECCFKLCADKTQLLQIKREPKKDEEDMNDAFLEAMKVEQDMVVEVIKTMKEEANPIAESGSNIQPLPLPEPDFEEIAALEKAFNFEADQGPQPDRALGSIPVPEAISESGTRPQPELVVHTPEPIFELNQQSQLDQSAQAFEVRILPAQPSDSLNDPRFEVQPAQLEDQQAQPSDPAHESKIQDQPTQLLHPASSPKILDRSAQCSQPVSVLKLDDQAAVKPVPNPRLQAFPKPKKTLVLRKKSKPKIWTKTEDQAVIAKSMADLKVGKSPEFIRIIERDYEFLSVYTKHRFKSSNIEWSYYSKMLSRDDRQTFINELSRITCFLCGSSQISEDCQSKRCLRDMAPARGRVAIMLRVLRDKQDYFQAKLLQPENKRQPVGSRKKKSKKKRVIRLGTDELSIDETLLPTDENFEFDGPQINGREPRRGS